MAQLICLEGLKEGLTFELEAEEITLGRGAMNMVLLPHPSVSRRHAIIRRQGTHFVLTDLQSTVGTFVNQSKISTASLAHDDVVGFGLLLFKFASAEVTPDPTIVVAPPSKVKLICQEGMEEGYEIRIDGQCADIGRDESNDIRLLHSSISRKHCRLVIDGSRVIATDLGSSNGSSVNGEVLQEQEVFDRDELRLGALCFVLSIKPRNLRQNLELIAAPAADYQLSPVSREDFSALDGSSLEGALIQAEIQSLQLDTIEPETIVELPEKDFLEKTLAIERERQQLFLLHEAGRDLMSLVHRADFARDLPPIVRRMFDYTHMALIVGDPANPDVLASSGDLSIRDLRECLLSLDLQAQKSIYLDSEADVMGVIRRAGGARTALVAATASDGTSAGVFYLDFETELGAEEQQFFEMFTELLSGAIRNTLQFGDRI